MAEVKNMKCFYTQPVESHFESGAISKLPSILAEKQFQISTREIFMYIHFSNIPTPKGAPQI